MILVALIVVSVLLFICALRGAWRAGYDQAWREMAAVDADASPSALEVEIAKKAARQ